MQRLYDEANLAAYDAYVRLQAGLEGYLRQVEAPNASEARQAYESRIEKISFEDARYALLLATQTNLGLTGNARALRDAIVALLSGPHEETQQLAEALRAEAGKVIPTLLKYASPSPYQVGLRQALSVLATRPDRPGAGARFDRSNRAGRAAGPEVRLLYWTGKEASGRDDSVTGVAFQQVLSALLFPYGRTLTEGMLGSARSEAMNVFREAMTRLGPHDQPPEAFKLIQYQVEMIISEANWHQFLRHSRKITFFPQRPGTEEGYTVPPNIERAGLTSILREAVRISEEAHGTMADRLPELAPYLVSNAHRRRVRAQVDLWELCHLIWLRGKPEAQWDIRETVRCLAHEVEKVHPFLDFSRMLGRTDS